MDMFKVPVEGAAHKVAGAAPIAAGAVVASRSQIKKADATCASAFFYCLYSQFILPGVQRSAQ